MGLARGEREVLHAIRKRMKAQTTLAGSKGWCSATDEQIASDSKYSVKQTRRIIAGLREKNILEIKGGTIKVKGKDRPRTFPGSRRGFAIHEQSACFREEERKKTSQ